MLRRWILRVLGALAALVLLLVCGVWLVGRDLDRPWIKSRVVGYCRDELGLGIDYEGLEVSLLGGVKARSFRLLTPASLAAGGEDFVRIGDLDVRARLWAFAFGERRVESLRIGSVDVAIVQDENGRTTLTELFPPAPEPEPKAPTRLSQSLVELPELSIDALEVAAIRARVVQLRTGAPPRQALLATLAVRGAVAIGPRGVSGTELQLNGAPLSLELSDGGTVQHAELSLGSSVRALADTTLGLSVHLGLVSQDIAPSVDWHGELLGLEASAAFDAAAGKTQVAFMPLHVLGNDLSLETQTEVFDAEGFRVVTSGSAHVSLAGLPVAVEGVALDNLALDLSSRELSWDGARVAGSVDVNGRLRGVTLDQPEAGARVADATLVGQGSFQPEGGRFSATLKASSLGAGATNASGETNAEANDLTLTLNGATRELAGAQQIDADLALDLGRVRLVAPGNTIEVKGAALHAKANASAQDLAAGAVPRLEGELGLAQVDANGAGQLVRVEKLSAKAVVDHLVSDVTAAFGVQGDASLSLALPRLRLFEAPSRPLSKTARPAVSVDGVELRATLPLTLAHVSAQLGVQSVRAGDSSLGDLALDAQLAAPLAWSPGRPENAQVYVHGTLARFDAGGGTRGGLDGLRLALSKLGADKYRVELDATGKSLVLAGFVLPTELVATLRSDAEPQAGALTLASTLRGPEGAALDLDVDARFDRSTERLTYSANLSAEKLDELSSLVAEVAPRASRVALAGARLKASAKGDLTGVLRAGDPLPELVERPLGTARGTESAHLELEGLDYRGADRILRVPRLGVDIDSTHRGAEGGNATAKLSLEQLQLEGGGTSLRIADLEQKLAATFERAPDQGMVDVRASLRVGSAAQSWAPGYPVKNLALSSSVQIDRLRSIYLRELTLDNPASGSSLRAAGTLELLGPGAATATAADPSSASSRNGTSIVGRQALSFEGRLQQDLAPLERLEVASHASGRLEVPFRLESGGMLGYRLIAALEAKQVSFVMKDDSVAIEGLNGAVPVLEEFALLESGPVLSAGPRTSPLSDTRFFDVHPFLTGSDFVTAQSIRLGGLAPLGPIAANVRLERSDFIIDQLQTGYQGGQIVGQVRVAYRDGDPIVRLRLNATGVRSGKSRDVFDANTALTFVPAAMTLDGKVQIVRASREHLDDILDVLDPFHESANANRVRQGLALGYPKFVRFQLHDGAVDTKVELGGIAQLVRIDEIRAVPLGPILQKYVAPAVSGYFTPRAAPPSPDKPGTPPGAEDEPLESAAADAAAEGRESRVEP